MSKSQEALKEFFYYRSRKSILFKVQTCVDALARTIPCIFNFMYVLGWPFYKETVYLDKATTMYQLLSGILKSTYIGRTQDTQGKRKGSSFFFTFQTTRHLCPSFILFSLGCGGVGMCRRKTNPAGSMALFVSIY